MSSSARSDSPPPTLIVTMTTAQLAELIRDAVADALEQHADGAAPARRLYTTAQTCQALECSEPMLRRWREAGMPCTWCGTSPRYEIDRCLEWLRQRGAR